MTEHTTPQPEPGQPAPTPSGNRWEPTGAAAGPLGGEAPRVEAASEGGRVDRRQVRAAGLGAGVAAAVALVAASAFAVGRVSDPDVGPPPRLEQLHQVTPGQPLPGQQLRPGLPGDHDGAGDEGAGDDDGGPARAPGA